MGEDRFDDRADLAVLDDTDGREPALADAGETGRPSPGTGFLPLLMMYSENSLSGVYTRIVTRLM